VNTFVTAIKNIDIKNNNNKKDNKESNDDNEGNKNMNIDVDLSIEMLSLSYMDLACLLASVYRKHHLYVKIKLGIYENT
jgi:hypothetical protein